MDIHFLIFGPKLYNSIHLWIKFHSMVSKALRKSIKSRMPGRFLASVYSIISFRSRTFWPMNLPLMNSGTRKLTLKCKFKCYLNPWITHWALALVKGNREPHEAKKKSFDLGGNRTHDLRIRSTVTLPTELQGRTEKVGDDFRWWIAANRK